MARQVGRLIGTGETGEKLTESPRLPSALAKVNDYFNGTVAIV